MRLGMKSLMSGTLTDTIENYNESELANSLTVVPLDGSDVIVFPMTSPQWSVHIVNTYENETSLIFDYCAFPDMPFRDPLQLISTRLNKTARDESQCRAQVKRAVLHLSGSRKGESEIFALTELPRMVEFPMIDFSDRGHSYCRFYGLEYWHDDGKTQSSIALRRTDLCHDEVKYWYRENVYPSEPALVSSNNKSYIAFVALHGEEKISKFHVIDAETFEDISETPLPTWIPFTAHGRMFSDN
jgi:carotenoid cleavage dioxygenase-like enzyme